MSRRPALTTELKKTIRAALAPSVVALRKLARFRLEPRLELRMQALGERKEFLGKEEHAELLALVAFTQQRSIERLEARVALKQLQAFLPEIAIGK